MNRDDFKKIRNHREVKSMQEFFVHIQQKKYESRGKRVKGAANRQEDDGT
jgi:hypothetical protein